MIYHVKQVLDMVSEIIDRIRDSKEKELFREALKGGYTIYLDEQNNMRRLPQYLRYSQFGICIKNDLRKLVVIQVRMFCRFFFDYFV